MYEDSREPQQVLGEKCGGVHSYHEYERQHNHHLCSG
jgi:hypothetical protein